MCGVCVSHNFIGAKALALVSVMRDDTAVLSRVVYMHNEMQNMQNSSPENRRVANMTNTFECLSVLKAVSDSITKKAARQ